MSSLSVKSNPCKKATKAFFVIEYESEMHNYNERGTFKIYRSLVLRQAYFQWSAT